MLKNIINNNQNKKSIYLSSHIQEKNGIRTSIRDIKQRSHANRHKCMCIHDDTYSVNIGNLIYKLVHQHYRPIVVILH